MQKNIVIIIGVFIIATIITAGCSANTQLNPTTVPPTTPTICNTHPSYIHPDPEESDGLPRAGTIQSIHI